MYKKLFIGLVSILVMVILLLAVVLPATATGEEYTYQIRITQNGQPVPDVYVRLAGIGVEMTDLNGIAVFSLSGDPSKAQKVRGDIYASKKGKASGLVADEYDILRVYVSSHDVGESPKVTCLYDGTVWTTDQLIKGRCPDISLNDPADPLSGDDADLHILEYEPSFELGTEIWIMPGVLYELGI